MRHNVKGRKLNKDASHRKAMLSNMVGQLFEHKQIKTTLAKAKEARRFAEKMITLGQKGDLNSLRQALKFLKHKKDVFNLFDNIAPVYTDRKGGYTRVYKLGTRKGDAAKVALLQLVDFENWNKDETPAPAKVEVKKDEKEIETAEVVEDVKEEVVEEKKEEEKKEEEKKEEEKSE